MTTSLRISRHCWLIFALLLAACQDAEPTIERQGKGGKYYGGLFNANESEALRSLFPLSMDQAASHRIAAQVYEGLVSFDPGDLSIRPALASSWSVDESGTRYTFTIRDGVRFHDDPCFEEGKGRELTAKDVALCFKAMATYSEMNQMFWLIRDHVLGANAHYGATAKGEPVEELRGVEVVDDRTVRITLTAPWSGFLQVLAHQGCWIYPAELLTHYGTEARWNAVGTGPFRVKHFKRGEVMVLERVPDHWSTDAEGNQLPFLDGIRYTFVQDKERELNSFMEGRLSAIYELPVGRTGVLDSLAHLGVQVQTIPGLTVQFYGFNARRAPFQDVRVRQAFSLAVDRRLIVDSVLNGLGVPAQRGVVAPGFDLYPYDTVPLLQYDPAKAKALLAEAGYPGGEGMPTVFLQVNNDGFGYVRVVELVQTMLERTLNVRVVVSVLPMDQHFASIEQGKAQFWREGWIVDHPDPENFLALFHGNNAPVDTTEPSYMNSTRYRNARFDSLFVRAQRTSDISAHMLLLAQAEKQLMADAAVMPLYHERSVRLLQPWVRDLPINGMEYRDMRAVWFDPAVKAAK